MAQAFQDGLLVLHADIALCERKDRSSERPQLPQRGEPLGMAARGEDEFVRLSVSNHRRSHVQVDRERSLPVGDQAPKRRRPSFEVGLLFTGEAGFQERTIRQEQPTDVRELRGHAGDRTQRGELDRPPTSLATHDDSERGTVGAPEPSFERVDDLVVRPPELCRGSERAARTTAPMRHRSISSSDGGEIDVGQVTTWAMSRSDRTAGRSSPSTA